MSGVDELEARIEIVKLAQLTGAEPSSLAYLEKVPPAALHDVREQVTDHLFDADRVALSRMAAAGRLLPVPLLTRVAENIFGPLLCARIAGLFDASRAAEVAARLSPDFLADTAGALDPRRARNLITQLPSERLAIVACELERRGGYVTMGRFVGHLPIEALAVCIDALSPEGLVRTAFVLEGKERIDEIMELLGPERRADVVRAVDEHELWLEAVELLRHMGDERQREFAALAAETGERGTEPIVLEARRLGVEPALAAFLTAASPSRRS